MTSRADAVGRLDIAPPLTALERAGVDDLWSTWQVCRAGCCLRYDGVSEREAAAQSLRELLVCLCSLRARRLPGGVPHRLDGMVVGWHRDGDELFAITVSNNRVTSKVLRAGSPARSSVPTGFADVVDLESRRARVMGSPRPGSTGHPGA